MLSEQDTQFFQRAAHALLCSIITDPQHGADGPEVMPFEKSQQDGLAIRRFQPVNGFIQYRRELLPHGIRFIVKCIHFGRLLFASLTGSFAAHRVRGDEARVAVQPAAQQFHVAERGRLAGQVGEHGLRDVARQLGVAAHPAKGGGINQVDEPADEFTESRFVPAFGVVAQQSHIFRHAHFTR